MWLSRTLPQPAADVVVLEANAAHAGSALACVYSSSDEFEAAIIRARREAGVYGPRRQRRQRRRFVGILAAAATIAALLIWIL